MVSFPAGTFSSRQMQRGMQTATLGSTKYFFIVIFWALPFLSKDAMQCIALKPLSDPLLTQLTGDNCGQGPGKQQPLPNGYQASPAMDGQDHVHPIFFFSLANAPVRPGRHHHVAQYSSAAHVPRCRTPDSSAAVVHGWTHPAVPLASSL